MKTVVVNRIWKYTACNISLVTIDGLPFCYSLELPWRNNTVNISCIPVGEYICRWQRSPKYGWCYQVTNVPSRSRILIHNGNVPKHTRGCLLLGRYRGNLYGSPAVLTSKPALRDFHSAMNKETFKLIIKGGNNDT